MTHPNFQLVPYLPSYVFVPAALFHYQMYSPQCASPAQPFRVGGSRLPLKRIHHRIRKCIWHVKAQGTQAVRGRCAKCVSAYGTQHSG